jgi:glutamate/tyrosine decarboxylase-like PLP-dependent enzyme
VEADAVDAAKPMTLPRAGLSWPRVRAALARLERLDRRGQRRSAGSRHAGRDVEAVAARAYTMFLQAAATRDGGLPSLVRMERDVVAMGLSLLNAPASAAGSVTSGGTESVLLATKACREWARARGRRVAGAEIIAPWSAHPSIDKAADLLGLRLIRVPVARDYRADVEAMDGAVSRRTIMLLGCAPNDTFGTIDDIAALGRVAVRRGLWLHVDHCIGGYLAPFARMNGVELPPFDFALPGVASISADLHKYGYAAIGASTVFYRSRSLHRHQLFSHHDWPREPMTTPTLAGTRPGGAIAAAWAVMRHLGERGYRAKAAAVVEARAALQRGIEAIAGLRVLGDPRLSLLAFVAAGCDAWDVHARMRARGWETLRLGRPRAIAINVGPADMPFVRGYLADLPRAVAAARAKASRAT